jgi:hypothetical protein
LAGILVFALSQIPPPGVSPSILSTHIESRYQQRSEAETGIHSPLGAVLTDYRSFDLLAVSLLSFTAALGLIFLFTHPPGKAFLFLPMVALVLGLLLSLGLGLGCLALGTNFLDFEALAAYFPPSRARLDGGLLLLGGAFLSLGGWLILWVRWIRRPEGSNGR